MLSGHFIVDLRDVRERQRDGCIPGSFHCPRGMVAFWVGARSPSSRHPDWNGTDAYCSSTGNCGAYSPGRSRSRTRFDQVALLACMRKQLTILNTMMKNGTHWNEKLAWILDQEA
jgi:hypothetical protein